MVEQAVWPTSGALLWVGKPRPSLYTSPIFQFARSTLCQEDLHNQNLFEAKTHPDFYLIEPEAGSSWIKVDQIRDLIQWAEARPQIATRKVALICPADALNLQAANALLKILEESMPELLFILISEQPRKLPATLLSRCHWIRDRSLEKQDLAEEDNLEQGNSVVKENGPRAKILEDLKKIGAKQLDPTVVAADWLKQDLSRILEELFIIWRDALRKMVQADSGNDKKARIMFSFLDRIYETKRVLQDKLPSNNQLLVETLLIDYLELAGL